MSCIHQTEPLAFVFPRADPVLRNVAYVFPTMHLCLCSIYLKTAKMVKCDLHGLVKINKYIVNIKIIEIILFTLITKKVPISHMNKCCATTIERKSTYKLISEEVSVIQIIFCLLRKVFGNKGY